MSGRTELFLYAIIVMAAAASVMDLAWSRIFNWFTFPMLVAGVVASGFFCGKNVLFDSLIGVLAGLILFGWMFWFRVVGGGDVKLLMAFGAWGGLHYVEEVAIMAVLVGGAIALAILVLTGSILGFLKRMYRFLLTLLVKELALETPVLDRTRKMPFGVSIAIAAVWVAYAHPLLKWGIRLWP